MVPLEIFDAALGPIFSAFQSAEGAIDTSAPVGVLALGLLTGLRHSMEADHVAAVSTTVASMPPAAAGKSRLRSAPILGALWGLGHTAALFAAGLAVLLLAVNIPSSLSGRLEFGVGVMLLFLAITTLTGFRAGAFLRGLFRSPRRRSNSSEHSHIHAHPESGLVHDHAHDHGNIAHRHGHKAIAIGMVHGMAGSGALMLVVLSTIQSVPLGLAYIAIFGAGSVASMAGISTLIGIPFARAGRRVRLLAAMKYASAAIALAIGAGLVYELGFVEQVFLLQQGR